MLARPCAALVGLLISGCAAFRSLPAETRAEETAWQSLHGVDALQTLSVARDPDCYYEKVLDPVTGKHPSDGVVVLWAATASALHFVVTDWLADHDHPVLVRVWEGITNASSAYWVGHNSKNGVRPFGHNEPNGQCTGPG